VAKALEAPEDGVESGLLPEAFSGLDRQGWSVLDLGPATSATVAFYASSRCRVGFADSLNRLADMAREWPMDPTLARDELREALPIHPERPWRLVLLWDLLDYMPGAMLERFIERLRPGLAAGACLHGFVTTGPQTVPARPPAYEILARDRLCRWVGPGTGRQAPHRYSPWHLQRYMPGVVQESSRQRRDARQEHLLRLDG